MSQQSTFLRLVCHFIVILKLLEMHQKPNRTNLSPFFAIFPTCRSLICTTEINLFELNYITDKKARKEYFPPLNTPKKNSFRGNHLRKYGTQRKINTMRTNLPKPLDLLIFCIYSLNFSLEFFVMIFL